MKGAKAKEAQEAKEAEGAKEAQEALREERWKGHKKGKKFLKEKGGQLLEPPSGIRYSNKDNSSI